MAKDPKKTIRAMMVLCIVIGLAALSVGIVAVAKEEYITATAMVLVTAWQVVNYRKWKRNL